MKDTKKKRKLYSKQVISTVSWALSEGALKIPVKKPAPPKNPPIFILGVSPRSGTHFLSELLRRHPDCQSFPLSEDYLMLHSGLLKQYSLEVAQTSARVNPVDGDALQKQLLRSLGNGIIEFAQAQAPGKRLILKTPSPLAAENGPFLFPEAALIFLIRDPRDVIESGINTFNIGFVQMIELWKTGALAIQNFFITRQSTKHGILVKYESLVLDTPNELRRILKFTGLDPETYPFDELSSVPVIGSSQHGTSKKNWTRVKRTADFKPIGRWLNWSQEKITSVQSAAGNLMREFGYLGAIILAIGGFALFSTSKTVRADGASAWVSPAFNSYTVKKADTWKSLATHFYGDESFADSLRKANTDQGKDLVNPVEGSVIKLLRRVQEDRTHTPAAPSNASEASAKRGLGKLVQFGKSLKIRAEDPSLEWNPTTKQLWMAFTNNIEKDKKFDYSNILLAASMDGGDTWDEASTVVNPGSHRADGSGEFFESAKLLYDAWAAPEQRWNLYYESFRYKDSPPGISQGFIGHKSAAQPTGPWSAEEKLLVTSRDDTPSDKNAVNISKLHPDLSSCDQIGEPGGLILSHGTYLVVHCESQRSKTGGQIALLYRGRASAKWIYLGTLLKAQDHRDQLSAGFSFPNLIYLKPKVYLMVSPGTHKLRGCWVYNVLNPNKAQLEVDQNKAPIPFLKLKSTDPNHYNGSCAYSAAPGGGVFFEEAFDKKDPKIQIVMSAVPLD